MLPGLADFQRGAPKGRVPISKWLWGRPASWTCGVQTPEGTGTSNRPCRLLVPVPSGACIVSKRAPQKAGCLYPSGYEGALQVEPEGSNPGAPRRERKALPAWRTGIFVKKSLRNSVVSGWVGLQCRKGLWLKLVASGASGVCRFSDFQKAAPKGKLNLRGSNPGRNGRRQPTGSAEGTLSFRCLQILKEDRRHLEMGALQVEPEGRLMCQSRLVLPGFAYFQRGAPQKAGCLYSSGYEGVLQIESEGSNPGAPRRERKALPAWRTGIFVKTACATQWLSRPSVPQGLWLKPWGRRGPPAAAQPPSVPAPEFIAAPVPASLLCSRASG